MKKKNIFFIVFSSIMSFMIGFCYSISIEREVKNKPMDSNRRNDKYIAYFNLLDKWLSIKEEIRSFNDYFINNGYQNIAVYGLGKVGYHLLTELKQTSVKIAYCIDKNADMRYADEIPVKTLEMNLPSVDLVIVTPVFDFENIYNNLKDKVECPIISLDNVVNEIYNQN